MLHDSSFFSKPAFCLQVIITGIAAFGVLGLTHADTLAMPDGQAYHSNQLNELTLDLSYRAHKDVARSGARFSLPPLAKHFVFFAETSYVNGVLDNVSLTDVDYSGRGAGGGLFYTGLADWHGMRSILRLSYNREKTQVDSNIAVGGRQAYAKRDRRNQRMDWLLSPRKPITDGGLRAYFSIGLAHNRLHQDLSTDGVHVFELARKDDSIDPHIAVGLTRPFKRFVLYFVTDYEQELSISLGLRALLSKPAQ